MIKAQGVSDEYIKNLCKFIARDANFNERLIFFIKNINHNTLSSCIDFINAANYDCYYRGQITGLTINNKQREALGNSLYKHLLALKK